MGEKTEDRPAHARSAARLSPDFLIAVTYIFAHLAYTSTLANALAAGLDRLVLVAMVLAIMAGAARALWLGNWLAGLLAIAVMGLIALQLVVFALLSGEALNWNAGLPYLPLAGFVLFVNAWQVREALLLKGMGGLGLDQAELSRLAALMRALSGQYDQATRGAASI